MPNLDDPSREASDRLDKQLATFEAGRARKAVPRGDASAMGDGYRFLAEVVGGVLGGLGLGWFFDRFAHTTPLGLISGLLIGTGASIFVAVRGAMRMSKQASEKAGPSAPVPPDEDE